MFTKININVTDYCTIFLGFLMINNVFATNINNLAPTIISSEVKAVKKVESLSSTKNNTENSQLNIKNLNMMDDDQNKIAQMKRQLEISKIQQQIRQTNMNGNKTAEVSIAKTVVTGVMINEYGNKLATLKFPDGGTLDVEIGTIIKNLKVIDISLNGVTLELNKKCKLTKCNLHKVFYARVYDAPQYSGINTQVNNGVTQPTSFTPFSSNTMVPPIMQNN